MIVEHIEDFMLTYRAWILPVECHVARELYDVVYKKRKGWPSPTILTTAWSRKI